MRPTTVLLAVMATTGLAVPVIYTNAADEVLPDSGSFLLSRDHTCKTEEEKYKLKDCLHKCSPALVKLWGCTLFCSHTYCFQ
ncbi:hypothetical protein Ptr902_10442 [Pyrenophora tritici-repentis]|uniref:Uncharacterized protein n=1 Tax=Pyrenophora tritici-repentis TaxID=45151 RepID=A0A5M9KTY0_9PLEO|nr:hypothetical protein PtrV1_10726 [Pyrenophora tritici-repentis]KAF7444089.1 hypothetical protein A1F99_121630 [Pyrenophora tritici-repentis]KAF7566172.1 hypothetical protein PtrM4_144920 [Pyrenophora tritici-repentis]KAI0573342.1 hypothetical protein Alg215_09243 [Pyrenophora tritici-repentis]KAI0575550.1 hypothetical protein Alg130_09226 [Pyrenophora tritici-repentis]